MSIGSRRIGGYFRRFSGFIIKNIPGKKVADMLHFIEESAANNASVNDDCQTLLKMVENIKSRREVGIRYMKACELEKIYREEGRELGLAEGKTAASYGIISVERKRNFTNDEILRDLQSMLGLSQEEAEKILTNYEKQ